MKKTICFVIILALCVSAEVFAQKKLGDYIEIDGVPAFIFQLDESGEHGLAMSVHAMKAKNIDKCVKKYHMATEQANLLKNNPLGGYNSWGATGKKSTDLFVPLIGRLTDDGKNNQEIIIAYCEENNLSLKSVFPLQFWAKNLGEGWFIPGDNELESFAVFSFGGLGKNHSLGLAKYAGIVKELSDNELIQYTLTYLFFRGLWSSSCHYADSGFRKLRMELIPLTGKHWLDLFDKTSGQPPLVSAVHEF